jgi:hypothetical protein
VGDLGIRAFKGLLDTSVDLLARERFDVVFITIFPTYPALIGPILKRRFGVPFVLDYVDPWVGAWGETVGGGPNGGPDFKSRLTRGLARRLEPRVVRAAGALTAVSAATYEQVLTRHPEFGCIPCVAIPYGGEPADFSRLRQRPRANRYFDSADGNVHVSYVGTLLPLGFETLRAVFRAARLLAQRRQPLYRRLRLHFFGTSNQTAPDARARVLPVARDFGVERSVTEIAPRIDYLDALTVQIEATALLMMGSSERHYTASKLYPGLLAERLILAIYHEASSVVEVLRRVARPPVVRLVTYNDTNRAESRAEAICEELEALIENPVYDPRAVDAEGVRQYSAESMAERLALVLERASNESR